MLDGNLEKRRREIRLEIADPVETVCPAIVERDIEVGDLDAGVSVCGLSAGHSAVYVAFEEEGGGTLVGAQVRVLHEGAEAGGAAAVLVVVVCS